jgi:hypothetical protein
MTDVTVTTLDPKTIRITMSVVGYLGVNEFYRKVDKIIQTDPTIPYQDALWAVVTSTYNRVTATKETV